MRVLQRPVRPDAHRLRYFLDIRDLVANRIIHVPESPQSSSVEQVRGGSVQIDAMSETTFPIEFIDGSKDGEIINATAAPEHIEVPVDGPLNEIYERQNDQPPFIYVQIGYAENETWK